MPTVTRAIVLCYHALSPTWGADLSTTVERFESQLELLTRRGYRGVTFSAAVASPHERSVAVTFDDAYRSVIELARPVLDRLGLPATVFAPSDGIDAGLLSWDGIDHWLGTPDEHELTPLTWQELGELAQAGWEIGSHTATHPRLTTLDVATLDEELSRSKARCEQQLGTACTSLAYPYGDVDARVVAATARAGYQTAAALPAYLGSRDRLDWPRVGVYRDDDDRRFRWKVSPLTRALRGSPLGRLVEFGAKRGGGRGPDA
jgi:peptidoglycan/xylan/chitin deacetylase (PgdA/CDA1 family)